jgi:hypothetical protein
MSRRGSSAEEILRRKIEPAVKAARFALEAAQAAEPGDPPLALALISMGLLDRFVAKLAERIADQDVAERVAVYNLVAGVCASSLGRPTDLVFPAVLRLCEKDDEFASDFPAPDVAVLEFLCTALLRVTVTYDVDAGKPGRRTVQVFLRDADQAQVRETTSTVNLLWEDVPEDVRGEAIRQDQRAISFTLYPREGD